MEIVFSFTPFLSNIENRFSLKIGNRTLDPLDAPRLVRYILDKSLLHERSPNMVILKVLLYKKEKSSYNRIWGLVM